MITWKSQDGTSIEGVLHKPAGFQPGRKYPLLVVIHGGPTGVSRPTPFASTTKYPIDVWLGRGVLVLEPNYRGSAGYGEKFRSLNVRNLGVGDAWDVLSGIDALIAQGLVDSNRVGAMGWSQGGYISAYLTTHDSARFKAGVGRRRHLRLDDVLREHGHHAVHASVPEGYAVGRSGDLREDSPMTYIKGAKAPTLIQHGATDQRVPPPNAFELYRGLQDQHVPSSSSSIRASKASDRPVQTEVEPCRDDSTTWTGSTSTFSPIRLPVEVGDVIFARFQNIRECTILSGRVAENHPVRPL